VTRVLVLKRAEVEELLTVAACVPLMREAFDALAAGRLELGPQSRFTPDGGAGRLQAMPAYRSGDAPLFALKAIGVFPGNPARGLDYILGTVTLFSGSTGEILSIMDAATITAVRTAAVSAVATDLLARPEAGDLAVVGAGVQARTHIEAMAAVRDIRRLRISNRSAGPLDALVTWARQRYSFPVEAVGTPEEAVRNADLIATVTSAREPIIRRPWVAEGAHLNVVGQRDVEAALIEAATHFVDRRQQSLPPTDPRFQAVAEGRADDRIELAEVLSGVHPGRTSATEITLFKGMGLSIADLAAAEHVYREALDREWGVWVDI
jgi:ornithine cyclodeaminase/alanine dehydrogenase-like protein (mu-crystallin family)